MTQKRTQMKPAIDAGIYFIVRDTAVSPHPNDSEFYSCHGIMAGIEAAGYDLAAHARKFRTKDEAQQYIDNQLPEWARSCHKPFELMCSQLLSYTHNNRTLGELIIHLLTSDQPAEESLLLETPKRMLTWRSAACRAGR